MHHTNCCSLSVIFAPPHSLWNSRVLGLPLGGGVGLLYMKRIKKASLNEVNGTEDEDEDGEKEEGPGEPMMVWKLEGWNDVSDCLGFLFGDAWLEAWWPNDSLLGPTDFCFSLDPARDEAINNNWTPTFEKLYDLNFGENFVFHNLKFSKSVLSNFNATFELFLER